MSSLPDKMSDLLELALNDLEIFKAQPNTRVNMEVWIRRSGEVCEACLAGAVILNTLKIPKERFCNTTASLFLPPELDEDDIRKLSCINALRQGMTITAYRILHDLYEYCDYLRVSIDIRKALKDLSDLSFHDYNSDLDAWFAEQRILVSLLREAGL